MTSEVRFLDLHAACDALCSNTVGDRAAELATSLRGVYVIAVGGFPIGTLDERPVWCGMPVSEDRVRDEIRRAVGTSALLTYMNKSKMSATGLSDVCVKAGHLWAYRWVTITLLFVGYGIRAELAFARDGNLPMSWPVVTSPTGDIFAASGHLAAWGWFTDHATDTTFDPAARSAMSDAAAVLKRLQP